MNVTVSGVRGLKVYKYQLSDIPFTHYPSFIHKNS